MRVRFLLGAHRARSSAVEQLPLKQLAEGSNPSALTSKVFVDLKSSFSSNRQANLGVPFISSW